MGMIAGMMLALTLAEQAQANSYISGDITFSGGVNLNSNSVNTATAVTSWVNPIVTSTDGDFSGITLDTTGVVTLKPWTFNSGALSALWSAGGFQFNLISSTIQFQGGFPGGVYVAGTGMITGGNYLPTLGVWTFSASNPGSGSPLVFSFQAASGVPAAVPDGGMTVAMLGGVMIGFGAVRSKMRK